MGVCVDILTEFTTQAHAERQRVWSGCILAEHTTQTGLKVVFVWESSQSTLLRPTLGKVFVWEDPDTAHSPGPWWSGYLCGYSDRIHMTWPTLE